MAGAVITDFETMPLKLLSLSTVRALCECLDLEQIKRNDYRALTDHLKLSFAEVRRLQQEVANSSFKSMTLHLLRKWADMPVGDANVKMLLDLLEVIERKDVIREIQPLVEEDFQKVIDEGPPTITGDENHLLWDGILIPTTDDVLFSTDVFCPGLSFDAFISYNPKSEFDRMQMKRLKRDLSRIEIPDKKGGKRFLNIVVGADELIAGGDLSHSLARAIRYRCKRVILLISRSFDKSEECVFQMRIARGLDLAAQYRKVIPVLIEKKAMLPDEICNLIAIDLTNPERRDREIVRLGASLIVNENK